MAQVEIRLFASFSSRRARQWLAARKHIMSLASRKSQGKAHSTFLTCRGIMLY
jgi:hypothetical protein